ncbi:Protein of unknown function [Gryllus bimaculatus]|nr:Protein of unknown function [Gryllus bimaculatus]
MIVVMNPSITFACFYTRRARARGSAGQQRRQRRAKEQRARRAPPLQTTAGRSRGHIEYGAVEHPFSALRATGDQPLSAPCNVRPFGLRSCVSQRSCLLLESQNCPQRISKFAVARWDRAPLKLFQSWAKQQTGGTLPTRGATPPLTVDTSGDLPC